MNNHQNYSNNNSHFNKNMPPHHLHQHQQHSLLTAPHHYQPGAYLHSHPNGMPFYDTQDTTAVHPKNNETAASQIHNNNNNNSNNNNKTKTIRKFQQDSEFYFDSGKC